MPQWLCNQLMRAFYNKNRRQIRLLNDCWYFYSTRKSDSEPAEPKTQP
ncbi:cortex morphogenetic protein CmpA [Paenibacillus sp. YYML68]|nr:cortex morphogenetic protein CmpA [Paenibacillus sp. YYML68]